MAHTHAKLRMASLGRNFTDEEGVERERQREIDEVQAERMTLCPCFTAKYTLRQRFRTFKQTWRKRIQKKEAELGIHLPAVETEVLVHQGRVEHAVRLKLPDFASGLVVSAVIQAVAVVPV